MNPIISMKYATSHGMTATDVRCIAAWHMDRSEKDGDRHDMIAFRLYRIAAALASRS